MNISCVLTLGTSGGTLPGRGRLANITVSPKRNTVTASHQRGNNMASQRSRSCVVLARRLF